MIGLTCSASQNCTSFVTEKLRVNSPRLWERVSKFKKFEVRKNVWNHTEIVSLCLNKEKIIVPLFSVWIRLTACQPEPGYFRLSAGLYNALTFVEPLCKLEQISPTAVFKQCLSLCSIDASQERIRHRGMERVSQAGKHFLTFEGTDRNRQRVPIK